MEPEPGYPFDTLPDLLAPGLAVVFVGINPSLYSVEQGHYFARPANRFWPAFSASRLSAPARAALGPDRLIPQDDRRLPEFGIGFTDVVKRPSASASELRSGDFQTWTPILLRRLERYAPRVACFHGLTGYRPFLRYGLGQQPDRLELGPQPLRIGSTALYVVPNPSPANASYRLDDLVAWYGRLAVWLADHEG